MEKDDWKKFQDTGDIAYYLQYKQQMQRASAQKETADAHDYDGPGASSDQNGRV